jgi:type II secretory pathway pseudopilin PulG
MIRPGLLVRVRRRVGRGEGGFTVIEMMVALMVLFIGISAAAFGITEGFRSIAVQRQQQAAMGYASKYLHEAEALPFNTLIAGLNPASDSTYATDSNILSSGCTGTTAPCIKIPGTSTYEHLQTGTNTSTGAPPLVPHTHADTPPCVNGPCSAVTYTSKVYVTSYSAQSGAYRILVRTTWNKAAMAGINSTSAQTIVTTTGGGCLGTNLHPFSGPCLSYLYGTTLVPQGSVTVTGTLNGMSGFSDAVLNWGAQSGFLQSEQIVFSQGQDVTGGGSISNTASSSSTAQIGGNTVSSAADNDTNLPDPVYQSYSVSSDPSGTISYPSTSGSGINQIFIKKYQSDTGSTTSTISGTSGAPCTQNTSGMSCSYETGTQNPVAIGLTLYTPTGDYMGQCNLFYAGGSKGTALTYRQYSADPTSSPFQPTVTSTAQRTFNSSAFGCIPDQVSLPSGWNSVPSAMSSGSNGLSTGFLVGIQNGYTQGSSACPAKSVASNTASTGTAAGLSTSSGGACNNSNAPYMYYWNQSGATSGSYSFQQQGNPFNSSGWTVTPTAVGTAGAASLQYTTSIDGNSCTFTEGVDPSSSAITSSVSTVSPANQTSGTGGYKASASMTSPMAATYDFKVVCGITTVANLSVAVNLGTMQTSSEYEPPPS